MFLARCLWIRSSSPEATWDAVTARWVEEHREVSEALLERLDDVVDRLAALGAHADFGKRKSWAARQGLSHDVFKACMAC